MMAPAMAELGSIDVLQAARCARRYAGVVTGLDSALPRLAAAVLELRSVRYEVDFSIDDQQHCRVRGTAEAELRLPCHRCLLAQTLSVSAQLDNRLLIDSRSGEGAAKLGVAAQAARGDLVVLASPLLSLAELLEDDLLLSLPQQICKLADCVNAPGLSYPIAPQERMSAAGSEDAEQRPNKSPFAVLQQLRPQAQNVRAERPPEIESYNDPDNQGR